MRISLLIKLGIFIVIACFLGLTEITTLTGPHVGTTRTYYAMFSNPDGVSGLREGNAVRVAGVAVGKVGSIDLVDATHAKVEFSANNNQKLTSKTWAVVRYANLLGQRYLALTQSGSTPGTLLQPGSTIPPERTEPALSLTALFNGFRPLFSALSPQEVNELSQDIIDILQGQGDRIEDLVEKTADLTSNLVDRDQTFTQVIDSLTTLLTTVSRHDNQLASIVTALHSLTGALHADGPGIMDSLASVDGLIGSVNGLFTKLDQNNLPGDLSDLASVTGVLAQNKGTVSKLIDGFVTAFSDFNRITQNGNWINAYVCSIDVQTYGNPEVDGSQIIPTLTQALQDQLGVKGSALTSALKKLLGTPLLQQLLGIIKVQLPLQFPTGPAGVNPANTKVCSP